MTVIQASELKQQLNDESIIKILENIGCHHIKHCGNYIKAGNKDGDNTSAITVYLDGFHVENYTRPVFQSKTYRDIISLVEFVENLSFPQAIKRICDICELNYYSDYQEEQVPAFLKWLDFVESGCITKSDEDKIKPISEKILQQFIMLPNKKWLDEGISYQSQQFFEIGFDIISERITIPIRDEIGNLVGIKGRLLDDSKIQNDKYIYLYPCAKSKLLYGLYQNYQNIILTKEVIVVEAEKSVVKLNSLGYKNAVAIGSKDLSDTQAEILLRLSIPITIALDQGVSGDEIQKLVQKLQYPVQTVPIYVIQDKFGLLEEKASPCDNDDTWKVLYNNFKEKV